MQLLLLEQKIPLNEKDFIKFLQNEGIIVKTNTKARGNLAICFSNRIDISQKVDKERRIAVLAHEYAHKIHFDMEKKGLSNGGSLEKLFNLKNIDIIKKELLLITHFVDKNSLFLPFKDKKVLLDKEISNLELIIKKEYPDFKKSKEFIIAVKQLKKVNSDLVYLLKYDRIRIKGGLFKKEKFYSIETLQKDFPLIPDYLNAYVRLLSLQRQYKRLYNHKNRADKYYKKPTELFARYVEGFFLDKDKIIELSPFTTPIFLNLLEQGYYGNLKKLFEMANLL
ncbi:MAG: hypothetical protein WCK67_10485 [bacterium]